MISLNASVLLSYYQARSGGTGALAVGGGGPAKYAPTPPWGLNAKAPEASELLRGAIAGRKLVDESAAKLDLSGASSDYKKLFALYQGLNTLHSLAGRMNTKGVTSFEQDRVVKAFDRGLAEVGAYIDQLNMDKIRLTRGEASTTIKSGVGVPRTKAEYVTGTIHTGGVADPVAAFAGDVKFDIAVDRLAGPLNLTFDLAEMGAEPRTLPNVIKYMNAKLEAEGLATRFESHYTAGAPKTTTVGGRTVTTGFEPDQWALKINGASFETLTFSAPAASPAIYLAQNAGDPNPDNKVTTDDGKVVQQFLKVQVDPGAPAGANYGLDGQLFAKDLGESVAAVRQQVVGPDGAVYMLADVTGPVDGQVIKGQRDVALMKYDSAGNLIYARTLGAADQASGMALAVADDGRIAIAGTVTGALIEGSEGPAENTADSFVTLFDANGEEVWTERRAAKKEDEATAVAFGADGTVYVAGRAKSSMPGAVGVGGWDGYLQGFATQADGSARHLFSTQFGTAADDKVSGIVVDGDRVVVAGVEAGRGMLRSFDVSRITIPGDDETITTSAAVTAGAVRDLGFLDGGDIAGIALDGGQIVVAGSTRNAALNAGTVTRAHAGGYDAFAARIAGDLSADASDAIAYYGGAGDDRAAGMTVAGGQVWLTGAVGTDLPGHARLGDQDGFVARLDVNGGNVDWSRRFTSDNGNAVPGAIAVDLTGASALDRLGLPTGALAYEDSTLITAATAARAGDQFQIRNREGGRAAAVTIEANDTLETLASKIRRAVGYGARVEIVSDGDVRRLSIKPSNERSSIEILAGKGGRDALDALGLPEGVVRSTKTVKGKTVSADGNGQVYGLKLERDLDITTKAGIKAAMDELSAAMSVIRTAYRDLEAAAKPRSAQIAGAGPAPAYLTSQIANYQAALDRLGG